ncbi:unnamed protein product [marine sediment metagenome]|uniref:DUF2695 domain-containing protein n=1 Tax=marine sediment metagenome TaxID=412755 RepID=X1MTB5_9ZZZZ
MNKKILHKEEFDELYNFLKHSSVLISDNCDNTYKFTVKWLKKNGFNVEKSLKWLSNKGGYCDCEVILNVGRLFDDSYDKCVSIPLLEGKHILIPLHELRTDGKRILH